jgi:hypothetical protein
MNIPLTIKIYWIVIIYLTIYAFLKQRQENGCKGTLFTIDRQCIDEDAVVFKDTLPVKGDNIDDLEIKMKNVLSYHERAAHWRYCLLMAGFFTGLIYTFFPNGELRYYIALHLAIFATQYFFFSFTNFHHMRRLKARGEEILDMIKDLYYSCGL